METPSQTFGYCEPQSDTPREYLTLAFSPSNAPLRSRWRNNGLSADFLGDYVTTFLPAEGEIAIAESRQSEIRHAVTYIANELLENAMKYHDPRVDLPIGIHLELTDNRVTVSATNGIDPQQAQHYQAFVENLMQQDASRLLVDQLEHNGMAAEDSTKSCLGLLTMINDYGAKLGWRFEPRGARLGAILVTTSAVLAVKEFLGARA